MQHNSLGFRRIAISRPIVSLLSLNHWANHALDAGADALLMRYPFASCCEATAAYYTLLQITQSRQPKTPYAILFYYNRYTAHLKPTAFHCKSTDRLPASDIAIPFGKSCHSPAEVVAAHNDGFAYAFLSPIYPTPTHPEAIPIGLRALAEAAKGAIPVFALGGITQANEAECLSAGAYGIAAISMFQTNE